MCVRVFYAFSRYGSQAKKFHFEFTPYDCNLKIIFLLSPFYDSISLWNKKRNVFSLHSPKTIFRWPLPIQIKWKCVFACSFPHRFPWLHFSAVYAITAKFLLRLLRVYVAWLSWICAVHGCESICNILRTFITRPLSLSKCRPKEICQAWFSILSNVKFPQISWLSVWIWCITSDWRIKSV